MSYDLYFWPAGIADRPDRLARRLADERAHAMEPDDRVLAFRAELLRRWPELADMIAPWHHDLDWRQPWGRTDLGDRFVGLTLSYRWQHRDQLPEMAAQYGLDCYDPQCDELLEPAPTRKKVAEAGPLVAGWVHEDHVVRLFEQLSRIIGYPYDELDLL